MNNLHAKTALAIACMLLLTLGIGVTASAADPWAQSQLPTQRFRDVRTVAYPDVFERAVAAHAASTRRSLHAASTRPAADNSRGGFHWTTVGLGAAILALAAALLVRRTPMARRVHERAA